MKSLIERYFDGENYIKVEKYPHYSKAGKDKGRDVCCRIIAKIPFTKYKICVRRTNITEFNNDGVQRIISIFGSKAKITKFTVNVKRYNRVNTYYIDDMIWVLDPDKDFTITTYNNVMYSRSEHKYYGYSHRGFASFGIGDNLFDIKEEDDFLYCNNMKYKLKFIWRLLKSIKSPVDFCYLMHDGIKAIVPFRDRGSKKIETEAEALTAAKNMAKHLD